MNVSTLFCRELFPKKFNGTIITVPVKIHKSYSKTGSIVNSIGPTPSNYKPQVRSTDDPFTIWPQGKDILWIILSYLNNQQNDVKFTLKIESKKSLPFLMYCYPGSFWTVVCFHFEVLWKNIIFETGDKIKISSKYSCHISIITRMILKSLWLNSRSHFHFWWLLSFGSFLAVFCFHFEVFWKNNVFETGFLSVTLSGPATVYHHVAIPLTVISFPSCL